VSLRSSGTNWRAKRNSAVLPSDSPLRPTSRNRSISLRLLLTKMYSPSTTRNDRTRLSGVEISDTSRSRIRSVLWVTAGSERSSAVRSPSSDVRSRKVLRARNRMPSDAPSARNRSRPIKAWSSMTELPRTRDRSDIFNQSWFSIRWDELSVRLRKVIIRPTSPPNSFARSRIQR